MNDGPARFVRRSFRVAAPALLALAAGAPPATTARAQAPSGAVEAMPALAAPHVQRALGFNIRSAAGDEWEFRMAREAGASTVRWHPGWTSVEDVNGNLLTPPNTEVPLAFAARYGLRPIVVTGYGPPLRALPGFTVAAPLPAGGMVIPVDGPLDAVEVPRSHVRRATGQQIVADGRWAYYGALVDAVDPAAGALILASPTSVDLAAGDPLLVNVLRYPSAATSSPDDPSVAAFVRYAEHVASRIAAHVPEGSVEIWNEPPWARDPWDARFRFYDVPPPDVEVIPGGLNWGFYRRLLRDSTPPPGVNYIAAATNKSGYNTLLGARMASTITRDQALRLGMTESFHPYGNAPEHHGWLPSCLDTYPDAGGSIEADCALIGTDPTSNFKTAHRMMLANLRAQGWTLPQEITEIGLITEDETVRARSTVRAFLYHLSVGMEQVVFFQLADPPGSTAFVDLATRQPLPAYLALKGLMADVATLPFAPAADADAGLPTVTAYAGRFPLMTVPLAGRESASQTRNTVLFTAWQRSYPQPISDSWADMPSPAPTPLTVRLPAGYVAVEARNLTTRAVVPVSVAADGVTYEVADDPVMLRLRPASAG